jgi:hypothetical protein
MLFRMVSIISTLQWVKSVFLAYHDTHQVSQLEIVLVFKPSSVWYNCWCSTTEDVPKELKTQKYILLCPALGLYLHFVHWDMTPCSLVPKYPWA